MSGLDLPVADDLQCPDGGRCHHGCSLDECWRVESAGPLSAAGFQDDEWPVRVRRAFGEAPDVFDEARQERARAHAKHGETSMESTPASDPLGRRFRILTEEIGEVAQEFNDAEHERRPVDLAKLRKELIQVAAMAGAWADACDQETP